jgi:hypothetical protein
MMMRAALLFLIAGSALGAQGRAGPLDYLRAATLTAQNDTLDTYDSPRSGGAIQRGNGTFVVRTVRQLSEGQWELVDTWFDSTNKETARQSVRTARGALMTELEFTRAIGDSASMSYTRDRVTGWVVPAGRPVQLVDGASTGERYTSGVVMSAIAKAKPSVGSVFVAPNGSLYGGNPIATRTDSLRVVRRDTLYRGSMALPVLVIARANGEVWVDESTGAAILARGNAGPARYWWHIRRGVRPPSIEAPKDR